jgi:hypothetical protein
VFVRMPSKSFWIARPPLHEVKPLKSVDEKVSLITRLVDLQSNSPS